MRNVISSSSFRRIPLVAGLLWLACGGLQLQAQQASEPAGEVPVDIQADRLEYRDERRVIVGTGNVTISSGADILKADYISLNTETYDAHARGSVFMQREGRVYQGEEARYNFKTRQGDFLDFEITDPPFFITSEDTERVSENEFYLRQARITTCGPDSPEFYARAREAYVIRGDRMRAKHVVFYYWGVPIFYAPWVTKHIGERDTNIDIVPGYRSRYGAFLLTAYGYSLSDAVRGRTRVDYRAKRGFGFGQEFYWLDPVTNRWQGDVAAYYTDDEKVYRNEREEEIRSGLVDEKDERYRLRLGHRQGLTDVDTARLRVNYLSDPFVLEDFFESEFRLNVVPENYATVTHYDPRYTLSLSVVKRLNDFYDTVDRLPEAALQVPQLRLGESPFFYESQSSASYLVRTFADGSSKEEYETARLDSGHTIYYPTRHFGWFNVIPRGGYQATYYDAIPEARSNTVLVVTTNEAGEVVTEEQVVVDVNDGEGDLRNLFELGFETSFKAFREIHNLERNDYDVGLRHVVEPFTDYTFIPEPNLEPADLYQFDAIDQLGERNDLLLGLRNKWQTKRNQRIHDLLDVTVSTSYLLDPAEGQEDFSNLSLDAEWRYFQNFWIDADASYDFMSDNEFDTANVQAAWRLADSTSLAAEYRYRRDRRDQVAGEVNLFPDRKISYTGYARFAMDDSLLEENSHFIRFKSRCVGYGLGFRQLQYLDDEDDYRIWAQLWLLAFPDRIAQLGK